MKKLVFCLMMLTFLILPSPVSAESNASSCKPQYTEEQKESVKTYKEDEASIQESYSIDFLEAFWNSVNINNLDSLIFGNPYCVWFDEEPELEYGIFPKAHMDKLIDPLFSLFTSVYMLALVAAIMAAALKKAYEPLGGNKTAFQEDVYMFMTTAVLLASYWFLIGQILNLNWAVVDTLRDFLLGQGIKLNNLTLISPQDDFNFTDILTIFAEWMVTLYLNFVYMMRTFMIAILMGLGGLAIISLLYSSTRSYFGTWLQDFAGALFLQSVHALYLTIVLLTTSTLSGETAVIYKLILLFLFVPLSTTIMNWMNLSSGSVATSVGMSGMNTLAATARIAGNAKRNAMKNKPAKPNLGNLGPTRISANASGRNSSKWNQVSSTIAKGGTLIGGSAGIVLGPGGAYLGAQIGKTSGNFLLQGSRNVASGLASTVSTIKDAKSNGFKSTLSNLQSRRTFFGNIGESMGAAIGMGGLGQSLGHALSGVSRQRLLNSHEPGAYQGMTLKDIFEKNPNAEVKWMQTNQGSAFYQSHGGQLDQISPFGAADPLLRDGERRLVDFNFEKSGLQPTENHAYQLKNGAEGALRRVSDAYIQGDGGIRQSDPRMNASSISPDSYFAAGMQGAEMRTTSDKIADWVGRNPEKSIPRHQGFV